MEELSRLHYIVANILELFSYYPHYVMSWGLDPNSIKPIVDDDSNPGIEFTVSGFKHKGTVHVLYDEGSDTFTFHLLGKTGEIILSKDNLYLDNLVPAIDEAVEKVENYKERVMAEYGISH